MSLEHDAVELAGMTTARDRMLARVGELFDRLATLPGIDGIVPAFVRFHRELIAAREAGNEDGIETALARLYCVIHGSGGAYAEEERQEFERLGGYWCHAGGLEPLHVAASLFHPETRFVDYGAGNGFQGLLFQYLHPHRLTTLVELSGAMIEQGRRLQALLAIPEGRVAWAHASIMDVPPRQFDVIYLYRPVRPEGEGRVFYEMFAKEVAQVSHPLTIVSVADCLKDFLPPAFRITYGDGQITCFTNRPPA